MMMMIYIYIYTNFVIQPFSSLEADVRGHKHLRAR